MDHRPVLLEEAVGLLGVRPGGLYVDGTVGLGGHAAVVLERSAPDGRLLGVDRDAETLERARARLAPFGERARLVHADFREVPSLLGTQPADGVLLDLGISSAQLDQAERGFSFQADGPLDMRMDRSTGVTAAEIVNRLSEAQLAEVIHRFGEDPAARRIARWIVSARRQRRIETTTALAAVVRRAGRRTRKGIDPATRTFQALRIHVNRELEGLEPSVVALARCLASGGRLVIIAFHSLEDRAVKQAFRGLEDRGHAPSGFRILTRKPVRPEATETDRNPRARSARLRCIERVAA